MFLYKSNDDLLIAWPPNRGGTLELYGGHIQGCPLGCVQAMVQLTALGGLGGRSGGSGGLRPPNKMRFL
jgi:hypothetical protein